MTQPFPQTPTYSGFDAPSRMEAEIFDLDVVRELPATLQGSWFSLRCGPTISAATRPRHSYQR